MIEFDTALGPVRREIRTRMRAAWRRLGEPGTWYPAARRLEIAAAARAARVDRPTVESTADHLAVAQRIAGRPATTTESWVSERVRGTGSEEHYVEAMGIAARVVMTDTFCRLVGIEPPEFPTPRNGAPSRRRVEPRPRRVRSWIAVGPSLVPPFTQALVPEENDQTYPLIEALYMTGRDMENADFRRGALHRTQIELVATATSYANECFY